MIKKYKKKNNTIKIFIIILLILILIFIALILYIKLYVNNKLKFLYEINIKKLNINKKKFIEDICKNIPFYKKYEGNFSKLPIITKKYISKYNELFININIDRMHSSINSANNSWTEKENKLNDISYINFIYYIYGFLRGKAIAHVSGGSSGNYFYQWYTLNEYKTGLYGFIKCWINMGWHYSEKILVIYYHGANSIKILNKLNLLDNIRCISPEVDENGDIKIETLYNVIKTINNFKPSLIVSFPSIIYRLSQMIYMKNIKLEHIPKYMDLSADFLFTCQYKFICSIFKNCDIRMSYGTIEFGQIAQQIPNRMFDYIVFDDIIHVENDKKNYLIITNYLHTTLPIIRYLTDDKGIVITENGKTIIHNLIGKSSSYDYIEIDNFINNCEYSIMNLRIDIKNKLVIITVLGNNNNKYNILNYFSKFFINYKIKIEKCNIQNCPTNDRYDRKNTPLLNEYYFKH